MKRTIQIAQYPIMDCANSKCQGEMISWFMDPTMNTVVVHSEKTGFVDTTTEGPAWAKRIVSLQVPTGLTFFAILTLEKDIRLAIVKDNVTKKNLTWDGMAWLGVFLDLEVMDREIVQTMFKDTKTHPDVY